MIATREEATGDIEVSEGGKGMGGESTLSHLPMPLLPPPLALRINNQPTMATGETTIKSHVLKRRGGGHICKQ